MSARDGRLPRAAAHAMASWVFCAGCASDTAASDDAEDTATPTDQAIIHGTASSAAQDAVIMLRIGHEALCSGTLVAPNLVLTARHCVSHTEEGIACAPDGHALSGGRVGQDRPAGQLVVYTGRNATSLVGAARAVRIFHDGATNLCNHDLALLLLDREVGDVTPASLRLQEGTKVGENVTAVGWGLTSKDAIPSARQQRRKVPVLDVGPSPETPPNDIVVGESICSGDSGGPALSQHGAVIAVVSYGGNGDSDPSRPSSSCLGASARNTYTRVAPFASLIRRAFRVAGHEPRLEHVSN